MKQLIDANILLDVLQKREPHYRDSALIWKLCETEQAEGSISALSIANLVYIMRKELSPETIEDVLGKLSLIFSIVELTPADIGKAAEMKWSDFEDALQAATAERIHAEAIITRNIRDFRKSRVIAFTPAEYLARI